MLPLANRPVVINCRRCCRAESRRRSGSGSRRKRQQRHRPWRRGPSGRSADLRRNGAEEELREADSLAAAPPPGRARSCQDGHRHEVAAEVRRGSHLHLRLGSVISFSRSSGAEQRLAGEAADRLAAAGGVVGELAGEAELQIHALFVDPCVRLPSFPAAMAPKVTSDRPASRRKRRRRTTARRPTRPIYRSQHVSPLAFAIRSHVPRRCRQWRRRYSAAAIAS